MESPYLRNLAISFEKQGPRYITKASFPLRYGKYSEIRTSEYQYHAKPLPNFIMQIIEAGGIIPFLQTKSLNDLEI